MKLVGYVRVSTGKQRERYGPDSQRADMQRWAKANGHKVIRWVEDAVSGTYERMGDREAWADALQSLKDGQADGILIPRLDRLSRDTIAQELLLRDADWRVYSALDGENDYMRDDPEDPTRKLVRTIFGAIATYDREMTVAKLASARKAKRARGGHAVGRHPYGYVDRAEQKALRRMQELAKEGKSTRVIAQALTAEGHPTKYGKGDWQQATVARILSRTAASSEQEQH